MKQIGREHVGQRQTDRVQAGRPAGRAASGRPTTNVERKNELYRQFEPMSARCAIPLTHRDYTPIGCGSRNIGASDKALAARVMSIVTAAAELPVVDQTAVGWRQHTRKCHALDRRFELTLLIMLG